MKRMRNVLQSLQLLVFLLPFALAAGVTIFVVFYFMFS